MKIVQDSLPDWLDALPNTSLPEGESIKTRYADMASSLRLVQEEVVHGATVKDGGLLTWHGPEHIRRVLQRAKELVAAKHCELSPFEVYVLMVAIQLHDIGNLYGRTGHEKIIDEIISEHEIKIGRDAFERQLIVNIASAHGGKGDTINLLDPDGSYNNEDFRPRQLAAILRLADELADDKSRAAEALLKSRRLPLESVIYHAYAHALHTVKIRNDERQIELLFHLEQQDLQATFQLNGKRVPLLAYIYERTKKVHFERMYCMRFLRPSIELEAVNVRIEIYSDKFKRRLDVIQYRIEESGYPSASGVDVYELCPSLIEHKPDRVRKRVAKLSGRPRKSQRTRPKHKPKSSSRNSAASNRRGRAQSRTSKPKK